MPGFERTPSLAAFLPSLLRERLARTTRAAPQSVDGVVLFVDIAGSTGKTDQLAAAGLDGAERLGGFLNDYFGALIDIVLAYRGDVVSIDGDALIAFWRHDSGRDAEHALAAAVAIREIRPVWPVEPAERLRHRLVLTAGRFNLLVLAGPDRRSFLLFAGDPLVTIGRIMRAGEPGDLVLDAAMAQRLSAMGTLEALAVSGAPAHRLLTSGPTLPPPGPAADPSAPFGDDIASFVPRLVVERATLGLSDWLAEFRDICVVYARLGDADLAGPEAAANLQEAFRLTAEAAQAVGVEIHDVRAVEKGVIATIGCGLPPYGAEGSAARAIELARRVRNALATGRRGVALGVAAGRVFCGDIGNGTRRQYILSGPVMNVGARLMEAADGKVLCDTEVARAASARFEFTPMPPLPIRGRDAPLEMCELLETRASFAAVEHAGLLHGRMPELAAGLAALDALQDGRGGLLAIRAEPGAGKSRLLAEIARHASARSCTVLATVTDQIDRSTAYYAFRAILGGLLAPATPERLLEALADTDLAPRAALMEDVLPLGFEHAGLAAQIRGAARRDGIAEIFIALLRRRAAEAPLLLLIDDLQWIDELSADLLLAVGRHLPALLVIAATRTASAETGDEARVLRRATTSMVLERLAPAATCAMACEKLGARLLAPRLADIICTRSEGLPIHVEQLVLALRERALVAVVAGRAEVSVSGLEANAIPRKLREIIVGRIDRLSQTDQVSAKIASAIGRGFDLDMLADVHPLPVGRGELGRSLERLAASDILAADGAGYAFRHAVIQETTHALLSFSQRRTLHRAVAEAIERRQGDALDTFLTELAHHWEEAADFARALHYRVRAAGLAIRRHANHDALMHAERASQLAERAGVAAPSALAITRGEAYHALSQFPAAEREFRAVLAARGARLPQTRARMAVSVGKQVSLQLLHRFGVVSKFRSDAGQELARLSAHFHTRFAEHAYFMRDSLALVQGSLTALNLAESVAAVPEMIEGYGGLAIGLGTSGAHALARFYRSRCIEVAERSGEMPDRAFARLLAGVYSFQAGDWDAMRRHCHAGIGICRQLGDHFRRQSCTVVAAYGDIATGHYDAAETALAEFGPEGEAIDNAPVRAWVLAGASVVDMLRGAAPDRTLLRLEHARHSSLHRAETLLCDGLEAAAHLRAGDPERAAKVGARALDDMVDSVCTMGIAMHSVGAVGDVFLTLAAQDRDRFLRPAQAACRAVQRYAAQTSICRPLADLLTGRLARLEGRHRRAERAFRRALAGAERRGLPLERALALIEIVPASGRAALAELGAAGWPEPGRC